MTDTATDSSSNLFRRVRKKLWRWIKRLFKWSLVTVLVVAATIVIVIFTRNHIVHGGTFNQSRGIDRVVLIVVDGMRADEVTSATAPNIYALAHTGAYTFKGLTDTPPVTPVAHMSLFTGLTSKTHGVHGYFKWWQIAKAFFWNESIYDYAHENGFETEVLFGWPNKKLSEDEERSFKLFKFGFYVKGVDHMTFFKQSPMAKSEYAFELLNKTTPEFLFLHFLENDAAGHKYGWMSKEQFKALALIDEAVGQLKKNLARSGLLDRTLIVLTADHGGLGTGHGSCKDIHCLRIPIFISGPGVKVNSRMPDEARIYDITPTILKILGDTKNRHFEGRAIDGIYKN